jgi:hypothetical protein
LPRRCHVAGCWLLLRNRHAVAVHTGTAVAILSLSLRWVPASIGAVRVMYVLEHRFGTSGLLDHENMYG